MFKKIMAEFIGTGTLVAIGCGAAMLTGCEPYAGYLITALAFGLVIVAMAYSIGNTSGCHINPAVSFAAWTDGRITGKEFGCYVIAQIVGAFVGSAITWIIATLGGLEDKTGAFGSNSTASLNGNIISAGIIEALLTFIFVLVILSVTANKKHEHMAGIVIGLTLVLVHLIGIGLTGTSVNPARSLGPALIALISGNMKPISEVWIFIIGPFVGALIAAGGYKYIIKDMVTQE